MGNGGDQTVWNSIDGLRADIKKLISEGCAKREGDLKRIMSVEDNMKEMRGDMKNVLRATIGSTITLLVLTCAFLLKYVLFR